jgi:hypothetical protein
MRRPVMSPPRRDAASPLRQVENGTAGDPDPHRHRFVTRRWDHHIVAS